MKAQFKPDVQSHGAIREITPDECNGVSGGFLPLLVAAAAAVAAGCSGANSNKVNKQSTFPK